MTHLPLTRRQTDVLRAMVAIEADGGIATSARIARMLGISKTVAYEHVQGLLAKGAVSKTERSGRAYRTSYHVAGTLVVLLDAALAAADRHVSDPLEREQLRIGLRSLAGSAAP